MTAAFQEAFGRLLLDVKAREQFLADPEAYANGFDASTSTLLKAINREDLAFSAENLIDKRRGHAREWMPHVAAALGARFKPLFRAYAVTTLIEGPDKHRADAMAFLETVFLEEDAAVRTAARNAWLHVSAGVALVKREAALPSITVEPRLFTARFLDGVTLGSKGRVLRRWRWQTR